MKKRIKLILVASIIAVLSLVVFVLIKSKVGADVVATKVTTYPATSLTVKSVVDLTSKLPSNYWDVSQGSSAQCIADELSNDNKIVTTGDGQPLEKEFGFGVFSVKNNTLSQIMPKDNQQLANQYYRVGSITNSRNSKDIYMGGSTDSLNNIALFNKVIFNTTGSNPENNAYSLEDIFKYASNEMKFAPAILMNDGARYVYLVGNAGLPGSSLDAKKIRILLYDPDYKNWVNLSDESYSENINSFLQPIIAKYNNIDIVTPRVGAWDTVNNYGLVGFELSSSKGGQGVEIIVKIKGNSGAPFEDITDQVNEFLGGTSTSFSDMTFNKDRKEIAILFDHINPLVYDGNVVKSMTQNNIRNGNYIMSAGALGSDWLIGGETSIGDRKTVLYQIKSNGVVVDLSKQVEDLDNTQYSKSPSCISSWYNSQDNSYETLILMSNRMIKSFQFMSVSPPITTTPTTTTTTLPPITALPTVTNPSFPLTVNTLSFTLKGTVQKGSKITVYIDINNDNKKDNDPIAKKIETKSNGNWSAKVTLTKNSDNNFLVTSTDSNKNESAPVDVPTITQKSR